MVGVSTYESESMSGERERASITLPTSLKEKIKEDGNMSETIEEALERYFETSTIHYVNTNAQYVPGDGTKVYSNGVVATYGDKRFGESLQELKSGDGVVSYVSDSSVKYDGGARAFGIVQAPWSGSKVPAEENLYNSGEEESQEYHVPVKWLGVLGEESTVSPGDIRTITGRKTPQRTLETPGDEYQHGMQLLAEVILGRTILADLFRIE